MFSEISMDPRVFRFNPRSMRARMSCSTSTGRAHISHWDGYDFVLINDDLDATEDRLKTIVTATRLRRSQQPGLTEHVRMLQAEFEDMS